MTMIENRDKESSRFEDFTPLNEDLNIEETQKRISDE